MFGYPALDHLWIRSGSQRTGISELEGMSPMKSRNRWSRFWRGFEVRCQAAKPLIGITMMMCLLAGGSRDANAVMMKYSFSGQVDGAEFPPSTEGPVIPFSSAFSGSYTFDDATLPTPQEGENPWLQYRPAVRQTFNMNGRNWTSAQSDQHRCVISVNPGMQEMQFLCQITIGTESLSSLLAFHDATMTEPPSGNYALSSFELPVLSEGGVWRLFIDDFETMHSLTAQGSVRLDAVEPVSEPSSTLLLGLAAMVSALFAVRRGSPRATPISEDESGAGFHIRPDSSVVLRNQWRLFSTGRNRGSEQKWGERSPIEAQPG